MDVLPLFIIRKITNGFLKNTIQYLFLTQYLIAQSNHTSILFFFCFFRRCFESIDFV